MLFPGPLSQNVTTRCPFYYFLDTVLEFSTNYSKQNVSDSQRPKSQGNSMNFTNILFCTFFQVALDKSKHSQISSRKSFYLDNLKVFRKANFCKLQSHSKTITDNRSLYFFQTKIRKSNHYSSISQSNSPLISPIISDILICNGISKYQVTWWTNFWSPWNHQKTVRPAYFNWF